MPPRRVPLAALCLVVPFSIAAADMPWEATWHEVAGKVVVANPATYPYNWGEGVQAIGMMKVYARTENEAFPDWVSRWLAVHLPKGIDELLLTNAPPEKLPGYCGHWAPATAAWQLYEATGKPEHRQLALETAAYITTRAGRSPEGALDHWRGKQQLWVDTLYMACPLLATLAKPESNPAYLDDAIRQILLYARHTQDPKSGLFVHMWDWSTNQRTPELWARGNGWVLMSIADVMETMKRNDKRFTELKSLAEQLSAGILRTQNSDGLWHTVLDNPSTYPETSASMMFTYGLLKLNRLKVLPRDVRAPALRAWAAVSLKYVKDGVVTGVSAGTMPRNPSAYKAIPLGSQPWGTGAYLMAGSEVHRLAASLPAESAVE